MKNSEIFLVVLSAWSVVMGIVLAYAGSLKCKGLVVGYWLAVSFLVLLGLPSARVISPYEVARVFNLPGIFFAASYLIAYTKLGLHLQAELPPD